MTNPQPEAIISSDINQNLSPQSTFPDQGNPRTNEQEITKKGGTLRQRLLSTILPSTLIPLLVASSITINITSYRAERDELANLEQIATIAQKLGSRFFQESETDINLLDNTIDDLLATEIINTRVLQIFDTQTGEVIVTSSEASNINSNEIIGGESIAQLGKILTENATADNPQELLTQLLTIPNIAKISLQNSGVSQPILTFQSEGRFFKMLSIPNTNLLTVMSVEGQEIANAGNELALIFGSLALFLVLLTVGSVVLLAQNFSQPIVNLTDKAKQVADGDLDVKADLEGTEESRTLAYNFNTLVAQVKQLIKDQENIANQQKDEKEKLEMGIYQLLDDLQDAMDGDLTVRASLSSMEMSTVADLCNAILDSLQDIALQVKEGTAKVNSALALDEKSIQELTQQAIKETQKTRATLGEVEQMSKIVAEIAENANQASTLADDAYAVTQAGSQGMDETVSSIINLRSIVGETAKKMKRLGESSQKISQVVSLIEEIALKTNLLAINASVEASRAGEQGQGFTVVAEQVGALAEQSASATKEIAKIVAEIQRETQEVSIEMESSTTEVVNTTRLVEVTKNQLELVLARSRNINELMRNISQSTVSQAQTSQTVEDLMEEIAQQSEERLKSSEKIVESMQNTAHIAQQLESAVDQFKIS